MDISKITPFEWNTPHVIGSGWSRQKIGTVIGAKFNEEMDVFSKLIFVKNGQVVYSDEYSYLSDFAGHIGGNKILTLYFEYENQQKGWISYYHISRDDPDILMNVEYKLAVNDKMDYLFSPANESQVQQRAGKFLTPS
ncbi:hypothetical protein [Xenorhabdus aichiensis]|uniref:Uncharacterized protein n=1 Tax=Xenorhabdus aichiensis TaxID=3025874 RepID=A0ABT5M8L2_9GAMM|nr:hypothetical protein [Xenorhabdus aichiensis]MDC9624035.1 hypothetical protein [Xenorhabdus aichiensis]